MCSKRTYRDTKMCFCLLKSVHSYPKSLNMSGKKLKIGKIVNKSDET